jgi:uncharacterized protein (DUF697 family)/GTPase SAR1 family protein
MIDYEDAVGTVTQEPHGWLDQMDWVGVRHEVETEARAEIALLGLGNAGKSTLFNSLRGWPVTVTGLKLGRLAETVEEPMGLFTLIDLPEEVELDDGLLERLDRAALLVYLLDGAVGCSQNGSGEAVVRPADFRWVSRLRATGRPLLVVLNKADLWASRSEAVLVSVERQLGTEVVPVSAYDSSEAQRRFLERMVEACPNLAVPLGREVARFRHAVAQRLIRRAALLCGLVAVEPIPLVDLPVQVGAQVGLAARIGAMYGHPPTSDYSRELVLTGATSVALRLLAQQAAKVVPLLGWAVSGLLAAATTWLLGQTILAYFEGRATHGGIGRLAVHLWRARVGPWCGRAVRAFLRFCPAAWVVRRVSALRRRRKANHRAKETGGDGCVVVATETAEGKWRRDILP